MKNLKEMVNHEENPPMLKKHFQNQLFFQYLIHWNFFCHNLFNMESLMEQHESL